MPRYVRSGGRDCCGLARPARMNGRRVCFTSLFLLGLRAVRLFTFLHDSGLKCTLMPCKTKQKNAKKVSTLSWAISWPDETVYVLVSEVETDSKYNACCVRLYALLFST